MQTLQRGPDAWNQMSFSCCAFHYNVVAHQTRHLKLKSDEIIAALLLKLKCHYALAEQLKQ